MEERKQTLMERLNHGDMPARLFAFLVPVVYYTSLISTEFTFGDGPELLTAARLFGVAHPSGYPLWTVLATLPSHIPFPSGYWNTAFLLSAIPTALSVAFIFDAMRRMKVQVPIALGAAFLWAFNDHVIYQATRIEVYALHCLFVAAAFWAVLRFAIEKEMRWAYFAVTSVCLGLTNHLTSAFMVIPTVLALVLVDRKRIVTPKVALHFSAIAAACASVYLYLPLAAYFNGGRTVAWNDPQTLERFWFHVTGKEYSIFRNFSKAESITRKFLASHDQYFFPGALAVAALGAFEWGLKHWRILVPVLIFWASSVAYIASYSINDIATYYTGLYVVAAIAMGLGLNWFLVARLRGLAPKKVEAVTTIVAAILFVWLGQMAWKGRINAYKEVLAQDMATDIVSKMDGPGIVFTAVDGHSFPLWYEIFANNPEKGIIPIDRVMFRLENKQWYRDWFRRTYPEVNWPSDDVAKRRGWESWLVRNNPEMNFYAMLEGTWRHAGTTPELVGWHAKLHTGPTDVTPVRWTKHIYTSRIKRIGGGAFMYDSANRFESGAHRIACVVEWNKNPDMAGDWIFVSPSGREIRFDDHDLPAKTGASWEFLEREDQEPGEWTCKVEVDGEQPLSWKFTLE